MIDPRGFVLRGGGALPQGIAGTARLHLCLLLRRPGLLRLPGAGSDQQEREYGYVRPVDFLRQACAKKACVGKIGAAVLAIGALAAAWRYTPQSEYITAERIIAWARAVREFTWAPVAVVLVLVYTPAAFVMFPRPLLTLLTAIAFGPWLGFAYGMTGIVVSAIATYYAGRLLKPDTVHRMAGRHLEPVERALKRHGLLAMFAVRIVPAAPFLVEGVIAGVLRIKLWHYTVGTFLGMVPVRQAK